MPQVQAATSIALIGQCERAGVAGGWPGASRPAASGRYGNSIHTSTSTAQVIVTREPMRSPAW